MAALQRTTTRPTAHRTMKKTLPVRISINEKYHRESSTRKMRMKGSTTEVPKIGRLLARARTRAMDTRKLLKMISNSKRVKRTTLNYMM